MVDLTVEEPVPDEHEKHTFKLCYAVIPAEVFFDTNLSPMAKLLFPIIQMLDSKESGCFASNAYLAKQVGLEKRQIQNLVAELRDAGHVKVVVKDSQRTIRTANYPMQKFAWGGAINCTGGGKKLPGGVQNTAPIIRVEESGSYSSLPLGLTEDCNPKSKTSVRREATAKTPKPPAPNMDHPAVIDYRNVMKLTPSENKREMIVGAVEDLELWGRVIRQWEALGFKKHNVLGMLESYKAGGIETRGKQKQGQSAEWRDIMAKYKEGIASGKIRGIL